jgi:prepilin peptidase CpaA
MPPLAIAGTASYAVLASWCDVRTRRIPNRLSGAALVGALVVAETTGGIGLRAALTGLALGAAIMLPPFALGAVGGGDLKFTAVAGAWLGPRLGFQALLVGTALGLVVALASAAVAGRAGEALSGAARLAWLLASSLSLIDALRGDDAASRLAPIPYALPLAGGVLVVLALGERGWSFV